MGINYAKGPFIMVCFTLEGVIQNGSIFKSWTHTSRHFDSGIAPPPWAICIAPPGCGQLSHVLQIRVSGCASVAYRRKLMFIVDWIMILVINLKA